MATGKTEQNIKVLFFAQFREQLGCEQIALNASEAGSIEEIKANLISRGGQFEKVFSSANLLVAVNQQMVANNSTIQAGDEVAFFPPVTGG